MAQLPQDKLQQIFKQWNRDISAERVNVGSVLKPTAQSILADLNAACEQMVNQQRSPPNHPRQIPERELNRMIAMVFKARFEENI
jgi:hypothetical protein